MSWDVCMGEIVFVDGGGGSGGIMGEVLGRDVNTRMDKDIGVDRRERKGRI